RLAHCLHGAKSAVDEMIVVDMGSADRTRDIAVALGAKVYDFDESDDVSRALIHAVSKASGDWIFLLEPDEALSPPDRPVPRELAAREPAGASAYAFVTRTRADGADAPAWPPNDHWRGDEEAGDEWVSSTRVRLFPNREEIRFQHPALQFLNASLERAGVVVKECDAPVYNFRPRKII
ncbi:MAG: glycosyltransferase, partial [Desulfobacterales bacterium]|nr:glycosyltransferase [Desulfobacterales bacterium]